MTDSYKARICKSLSFLAEVLLSNSCIVLSFDEGISIKNIFSLIKLFHWWNLLLLRLHTKLFAITNTIPSGRVTS